MHGQTHSHRKHRDRVGVPTVQVRSAGSPRAIAVLAALWTQAGRHGHIRRIDPDHLARMLTMDPRTVRLALDDLEQCGALTGTADDTGRVLARDDSNGWTFIPVTIFPEASEMTWQSLALYVVLAGWTDRHGHSVRRHDTRGARTTASLAAQLGVSTATFRRAARGLVAGGHLIWGPTHVDGRPFTLPAHKPTETNWRQAWGRRRALTRQRPNKYDHPMTIHSPKERQSLLELRLKSRGAPPGRPLRNNTATKRRREGHREPIRAPYGWQRIPDYVGDGPEAVITWNEFARIRRSTGVEAATAATLTVAYRIAHGHRARTNPAGWIAEIARCYRGRCRIDTDHGSHGHEALIVHRSRWADWLQETPRAAHQGRTTEPGQATEPPNLAEWPREATPGPADDGYVSLDAWIAAAGNRPDPARRNTGAYLAAVPSRWRSDPAADKWATDLARRATTQALQAPDRQ